MNREINDYHKALEATDKKICNSLYKIIDANLPNSENKVWHGHPVWFLEGNPIVGYSKLKGGIKLMFWSGDGFDEPLLKRGSGKFKDASIYYLSIFEIMEEHLIRWLQKSIAIQWDYKNIVKRKGRLDRLK